MRLSAGKTYAVKIEYYQGTGAAIIDFIGRKWAQMITFKQV